jgi:hypothetical protein
MSKKLSFYFSNLEIRNSITPAKKHIPDWYKKTSIGKFTDARSPMKKTIKNCMPFLDSLTTGYMIETTQDLRVTIENGLPIFQWTLQTDDVLYIGKRETHHVPTPAGYYEGAYIWSLPNVIKSPKGYSLLMTHPLNRTDLPFLSLSGVMDADEGIGSGNYPFFIREGFEGIIPTGTPIVQVIPFKRESWEAEHSESLANVLKKQTFLTNQVFSGWYKNSLWRKKEYK